MYFVYVRYARTTTQLLFIRIKCCNATAAAAAAVLFVVSRMEADEDIGNLGPKEVVVRMMFAPINPSDINQVSQMFFYCMS